MDLVTRNESNMVSSTNSDLNFAQVFHAVFLMVVFIIGTVGNIMTIIAVKIERKLRKSVSNLFVINLAVADLIVCSIVVPLMVAHNLYAEQLIGPLICYITVSVSGLACHTAAATMSCIALTRYIAAVRASKYRDVINRRKVCTAIICVWIFSAINTTPILLGWLGVRSEELRDYVCVCFDGTFALYYTLESVFIGHFLPHGVTVYCYYRIVGAIRRSRKRIESGQRTSGNTDTVGSLNEDTEKRKSTKAGNRLNESESLSNLSVSNWSRHEIQLVKTSIWIIGFFSFCWIPSAILVMLQELAPLELKKAFGSLCLLSFSLNPIIYGLMNRSFGKAYLRILNKISCGSCGLNIDNRVATTSSSVVRIELQKSPRMMNSQSKHERSITMYGRSSPTE